jgi:hypothetical protein
MLKFSQYIEDEIDKAWFDSSNVVYGECDESDTQYKTVRITFKNGSVYQYSDVLVSDWVKFKNAGSQGKALNECFVKNKYKYEKIGTTDINNIMAEYDELVATDFFLEHVNEDNTLVLSDNQNNIKYKMTYPGEDVTNDIKGMLESIKFRVKLKG